MKRFRSALLRAPDDAHLWRHCEDDETGHRLISLDYEMLGHRVGGEGPDQRDAGLRTS